MTRFAKVRWVAFALPLLLSCAENDQKLRVVSLAETGKGFGSGCVAGNTAIGLSRGILDLAAVDDFTGQVPVEYRVFVQVENGFVPPGAGELGTLTPSPGVADHTVVITDVVTELNVGLQTSAAGSLKTVAGLGGADLKFRTPIFARIDGGGTSVLAGVGVPESAVIKLARVRDAILPQPSSQVVISARLRVFGKKDGVSDVESSFVDLPISLCNGCLYKNISSCDNVTDADATKTGSACSPIQDYPLRCCKQAGMATLVCPAVKTTPTGAAGAGG